MGRALEAPEKPLAALMGGAKVSDKILVLETCWASSTTFSSAAACASPSSTPKARLQHRQFPGSRMTGLDFAKEIVERAKFHGIAVHLPDDLVVASEFGPEPSRVETVEAGRVPDASFIMDIGPNSARHSPRN